MLLYFTLALCVRICLGIPTPDVTATVGEVFTRIHPTVLPPHDFTPCGIIGFKLVDGICCPEGNSNCGGKCCDGWCVNGKGGLTCVPIFRPGRPGPKVDTTFWRPGPDPGPTGV